MALQTTTNINVDFYDKEYIMLNAKQYDDVSRFISITCYDQGNIMNINEYKHTAYIRYRKADGYGVLNSCRINSNGNVLVELTEQMLAADGICYVDLIIVNKGKAIVNLNTNEISVIDDSPILSTMAFCINVYEAAIDSSEIESSNEYGALNDALQQINADYSEVIRMAKSYAMGNANNIRENEDKDNSKYYYQMSKSYAMGDSSTVDSFSVRDGEEIDNSLYYSKLSKSYAIGDSNVAIRKDTEDVDNAMYYSRLAKSYAVGDADDIRANEDADNAKYYSEQSSNSANAADTSEANAKASEINAKNSETAAANSATAALASQNAAKTSETNAKTSENNAKTSESNAKTSETNAKASETNAKKSESAASTSATNAANSENATKISETNALNSATAAAESKTNAANSATAALNSKNAAKTSEANAKTSETNAAISEANALNSYNLAKSYVVGGTGVRDNEDIDNAKYYHELISSLVDGTGIGIATVDEVKSYLGI